MAAGFLSPPGTEYGPCTDSCEHIDCQATREMAKTICSYCGEPIGYDRRFFQRKHWRDLMHAACHINHVCP